MSTRGTSTEQTPNWRTLAACAELEDVMFPDITDVKGTTLAKSYCARCPVLQACLDEAMAEEGSKKTAYRYGIRGGLTTGERYRRYLDGLPPKEPVEARPRVSRKPPAPCGTEAGYHRHKRHGEPVCDDCRQEHNAQKRERLSQAKAKADAASACGTRRGYHRHRRNGEPACDPCRWANDAADRRLRATGSTKAMT